ncbi:MAG: dihydrolipoyl dehydrogenase [Nitrospira sp.]|nr:dihydrolipoyl dehydrogenase [Nitrospira sp.]MDH4356362.1 dihydrolipoyl dehydrogenase [Nitrospira sp.]MDH5318648.1 dihydrolipoyl dehydrogenase [Nitrospira sp.]
MKHDVDVAIIGAGSAGLSALREIRRHTENFVLINHGAYGTTCARVGCMPSKALIEAANAFHHRHRLPEMGISGGDRLTVDRAGVLHRVRTLRDAFVSYVLERTQDLGERNIAGHARFVAPHVLEVNGARLKAGRVIIATGSRPIVPPAWKAFREYLITSDDLFEMELLPPRMAVVGLGSVGAEMAQALSRLGIEVTGFDRVEQVAGVTDPVVNRAVVAMLKEEFPLYLGSNAELHVDGAGVRVSGGANAVTVDKVLVALGRRPNVDGLSLDQIGAELDGDGIPRYDPRTMQVGDLPVYIAGDSNGHLPLLHEAVDEGHIAGYNASRERPECFQRRTPLSIVFTDPNIAAVGQVFGELNVGEMVIGEFDFSDQGRALMAAENHGPLRVYADRSDGRLVGAELCAPRGEHLAHLLACAIHERMTAQEFLRLPFYHPTVEEGMESAVRKIAKRLTDHSGPDLASCESIWNETQH